MYAVFSRWELRAPIRPSLLTQLDHQLIDPISRLPGFQAYYVVPTTPTVIAAIHFWESQADAESALQQGTAWVRDLLAEGTTGVPERSAGEVSVYRSAQQSTASERPAFASLNRFHLRGPLSPDLMTQIDQELVVAMAEMPGFRSYYGVQTAPTTVETLHIWDSQAEAERALQAYGPRLAAAIADQLTTPPERRSGEVALSRAR